MQTISCDERTSCSASEEVTCKLPLSWCHDRDMLWKTYKDLGQFGMLPSNAELCLQWMYMQVQCNLKAKGTMGGRQGP